MGLRHASSSWGWEVAAGSAKKSSMRLYGKKRQRAERLRDGGRDTYQTHADYNHFVPCRPDVRTWLYTSNFLICVSRIIHKPPSRPLLTLLLPTPPHRPPLHILRLPRRTLSPSREAIPRLESLHTPRSLALQPLSPNLPIRLPPLIARSQRQLRLDDFAISAGADGADLWLGRGWWCDVPREVEGIWCGCCGRHLVSQHAQFTSPGGVGWLWEGVVFLEDDADVLSFRVEGGIAVVLHVAGDLGMNGVVSTLYTHAHHEHPILA